MITSMYLMFALIIKTFVNFDWDVAIRDVQRNLNNQEHVSEIFVELT